MKKLPKARQNHLVIQQFDRELLVYDLETNKAYSLNETTALVFAACNGETTFDDLIAQHKFTDDLIFLALDELKKESLIADNGYQSPFAGMSRREAAKKVGLATMLALPVIASVVAPVAAAAESTTCMTVGEPCVQVLGSVGQADCCPMESWCQQFANTCSACYAPMVWYGAIDCSPASFLCCSQSATTTPFPPSMSLICTCN